MKTNKQPRIIRYILLLLGLVLVGAGGYFLYGALNQSPEQTLLKAPAEVQASAKKRTAQQKQEYTVPPSHPRRLMIPKLGVDAVVLPMETVQGAMDAPASAWDVGWYDQSGKPGRPGAMLIDGHVNDALGSPGVFARISSLQPGDTLQIERGDRQIYEYTVVKTQQLPLEDIDMLGLLEPAEAGKEGLNLITCGGTYDAAKKTFHDRVIVQAVRAR